MTYRDDYLRVSEEYAVLTDEINAALAREADDPDLWDGDTAESELLRIFVHWLPDIVRHAETRKIFERAEAFTPDSTTGAQLRAAADELEPFFAGKDRAGTPSWFRKRDGRLVPYRVLTQDPTPDEQKEDQHV